MLVRKKVNVEAVMKEWTPLNFATYRAYANVFKLLLDIGANPKSTSEPRLTLLKLVTAISK